MSSSNWSKLLTGEHAGAWSPGPLSAQVLDAVDLRLEGIIRSASLAWPTVDLSPKLFIAHLARHLPKGIPIDTALEQIHTDDLYLACACAFGDKNAILAFERHCLTGLENAVSRYRASYDLVGEVKQRVRERALVSNAGSPRIEGFSGRGDLRSWVRVMAVREAIGLARQSRRETPTDDDTLLHAFVTPADAELEHVKARYVEEFNQAFSAALRGLSVREQTLLRQHVIDGLTIDQLGVLYHVHRATVLVRRERDGTG